ncbi:MAG: response regulator [bacterium]|nr:response regulator [bacterium]
MTNIDKLSIILSGKNLDKPGPAMPSDVPILDKNSHNFFKQILDEIEDIKSEFTNSISGQKVISDLGIKLTSANNIKDISETILDCALILTKTPAGSISLYDEKENTLNLVSTKGFSPEFSEVKKYPVRTGGMTEYILKQKEPIIVNNIINQPSFNNPMMLKEKVSSLIAVSLFCEEKIVGILYVDDFVPRNFLPEQIALLSLLAMQAAFGIEKIKLLTELEKKNQELSETTEYMKAVLDNSADMIITTDSQANIVEFNPAGERMLGFKKEEVYGTSVEKFYRHAEERRKIIEKLQKKEQIANYETKLWTKNGKLLDISLSLSQLKNKDGNSVGTVGISKDISKQKQLEKKLREANKELEQKIKEVQKIEQMKSDFLSVVSHELRTPLTSILGFAKMIQRRFTKDILPYLNTSETKMAESVNKIQENLKIITSEGERLARLINNVLDLAKIEAGKMEWKVEPAKMEEICKTAMNAVSSLADHKKLNIKFLPDEDLPLVNVDQDRLIQVVTNLFSNAIKFTNTGSVTCIIKNLKDTLEVRIKDSGVGIKPEDIGKLFEKFKQVGDGDTVSDKPKGTGLGLTICKEIIEALGGKIWVESEYGKGSSFIFTLPAIIESAPSKAKKTSLEYAPINISKFLDKISRKEKGHLILIVDDESHIRTLLREELEEEGYKILEAANGNDALVSARKEKPDLIICDILMPGLNGFDVLTLLKTDENTSDIPILIHSIYEDKEKGYKLGADKYITKSVNTETLIKSVSDLLSGKDKKTRNKKVLLIEEDKAISKTIHDVLKSKGYQVIFAYNSKEGLEKAKIESPDLIIIDDLISKANGYEILRTIQTTKETQKSNIVILTRDK